MGIAGCLSVSPPVDHGVDNRIHLLQFGSQIGIETSDERYAGEEIKPKLLHENIDFPIGLILPGGEFWKLEVKMWQHMRVKELKEKLIEKSKEVGIQLPRLSDMILVRGQSEMTDDITPFGYLEGRDVIRVLTQKKPNQKKPPKRKIEAAGE